MLPVPPRHRSGPYPALLRLTALILCLLCAPWAVAQAPKPDGAIRIATFNVSLARKGAGVLLHDLRKGRDRQVAAVAEILQRVRPDILFLNELDHDPDGLALTAFRDTLREGRNGAEGLDYPHLFSAPVNTGVQSGHDLDQDGVTGGAGDAFGWGRFPGQYGMAVMSRFPIQTDDVRSFQKLLWRDMPGALIPTGYFGAAADVLRLSSKSHWDAPVALPDGRVLHVLGSHPTPPVFDGPEDRNGRRNHDEVRFWSAYLEGADWIVDDAGLSGGLAPGAWAVVLGDLNLDGEDGAGLHAAILSLRAHPRLQDLNPTSEGAVRAAEDQGGANARHRGDPALDTADWRDDRGPGNLRVDYILPDARFEVLGSGVFWPAAGDPLARLVKGGRRPASSDHRLVWVDVR